MVIEHSQSHCVKSVRIWSYSGPYFPAFALNTERYGVSLHIQSECRKIRTRITTNTDTFHAVSMKGNILKSTEAAHQRCSKEKVF